MYRTQGNSFSMLFNTGNRGGCDDQGEMYAFNAPAPAPVDCTLSLGTPSTRLSSTEASHYEEKRRSSSYMSSFGWNILQPSSKNAPPPPTSKGHRSSGGDPLLARRCANCDTTSTPLWRNGPRGPKSLCNACGIRFKKEERRATAAAASGGDVQQYMVSGAAWPGQHQHQKTTPYYHPSSAYGNEFRFIDDDDATVIDPEAFSGGGSIPFVSWRFNVTDRPSFVHDFTR